MDDITPATPTQAHSEHSSQSTPFSEHPLSPVPAKRKKLVPLLLGVLAIVLIAGAAYGTYVWQHKKVTNLNGQVTSLRAQASSLQSQVTSLQTQVTKLQKSAAASSASTASATSVVKIAELGVEVTVPNAIKDIVTKTNSTGTLSGGQKTESVMVSTQTLTKLDPACSVSSSAPPLGELTRATGQYPKKPDVDTNNAAGSLVKQYATYYIGYISPQATCSTKTATQNTVQADLNLFTKALKTVKPVG